MAIFSSDIVTSAISASITDTAVDVFVYDTTKDSDGGAWRKRTQHTSWYNETLGTSTRGSRKEFPAVAVIVAENTQLTIYDGDDPDLPMWMVFNFLDGETHFNGYDDNRFPSSVAALNGTIVTGIGDDNGFLNEIGFIEDAGYSRTPGYYQRLHANISQRNQTGFSKTLINTTGGQIHRYVYKVAMAVLPNAQIDKCSGLPGHTIVAATKGGVSVIKDDGTVVDLTSSQSGYGNTQFTGITTDNKVLLSFESPNIGQNARRFWVHTIPDSDTTVTSSVIAQGSADEFYKDYNSSFSGNALNYHNYPEYSTVNKALLTNKCLYLGLGEKVTIIERNKDSAEDGMLCNISKDYNTGWLQGKNCGAFLSSTDTTDLSGYLYEDTMQSDNTSNWTDAFADTFEHITSPLIAYRLVRSIGDARVKKDLAGTISQGTKIIVTYEAYSSSGSKTIKYGMTTSAYDQSVLQTQTVDTNWNPISFEATFGVTGSGSHTFVTLWNSSTGEVRYRNFRVRVVEEDRSVKMSGLAYFGTITKNPVATGAELVAYSGFNSSNYLRQNYNSAVMNHGTGNFCYTMWVNIDDSGTDSQTFVDRSSAFGATSNPRLRIHKHTSGKFRFWTTNGAVTNTTILENAGWTHLACVRRGGTTEAWVNGYLEATGSSATDFTSTAGQIQVGLDGDGTDPLTAGSIALVRVSNSAPSAEQIKQMYEDEKHLFQENAKATLHGDSDVVTALDYDESTNLLHVGTSGGRSDFQGLRRINNTTTAVTTAISAHDEFIAEQ